MIAALKWFVIKLKILQAPSLLPGLYGRYRYCSGVFVIILLYEHTTYSARVSNLYFWTRQMQ